MSVRLAADGAIELVGDCPSDDAEIVLEHLLANPTAIVDWTQCETLHSAVIQVLLVARPGLRGQPHGPRLRQWIAPLFAAPGA